MNAHAEPSSIKNFTQVDVQVYRGEQPTEKGYEELQAMGIKTLVNFRHEDEWRDFGKEHAEKHGMRYIHIPWTIFGDTPNFQDIMNQIENAEKPLFFHCRRGVERTGVMHWIYANSKLGKNEKESEELALNPYPVKWFWRPFVNSKIEDYKNSLKK